MEHESLEERYEKFRKLKGFEQIEYAEKHPHEVCSIIWYLEGWIQGYDKAEESKRKSRMYKPGGETPG